MERARVLNEERLIDEKADILIAIGSAIALNCIPCFEHLILKR